MAPIFEGDWFEVVDDTHVRDKVTGEILSTEDEDYDEDGIPEGCAACGGNYPHCKSSCPLFDD